MKYFTIKELCRSNKATELEIDNTPTDDVKTNLTRVVDNLLDNARERLGRPITVNSGYRCPKLNKAVGGTHKSQHMVGKAVDITAGTKERNKQLFEILKTMEFDQLIDERDMSWIHISFCEGNNRNQILKL